MPNTIDPQADTHPTNLAGAQPVLERLLRFGGARAAFLLNPRGEVACCAAPIEDEADLRLIAGGLMRSGGSLTSDRIRLSSGSDQVAAHAVLARGVLVVVSSEHSDTVRLDAAITGAISALEHATLAPGIRLDG